MNAEHKFTDLQPKIVLWIIGAMSRMDKNSYLCIPIINRI
ncbi:hypothetical protein DI53_1840 [Sphingobacterium deserti]|uniref:Uncharacterized protein n=1 Tax=Sphingobacterium deserti TaxID=1229276 RepID=A0A0B8T4C0_9SPHI|nr:hypothetical protein DI53_1840 [Sphingobacterium deserti]